MYENEKERVVMTVAYGKLQKQIDAVLDEAICIGQNAITENKEHYPTIGSCKSTTNSDMIPVIKCYCGREVQGSINSFGKDRGHYRFDGKCKNGHDLVVYV